MAWYPNPRGHEYKYLGSWKDKVWVWTMLVLGLSAFGFGCHYVGSLMGPSGAKASWFVIAFVVLGAGGSALSDPP
jgi:hypothetical protein